MAKLGYLFLNDGSWRGRQIVSEAWIEESTKAHAVTSWGEGYGYQWWLRTYYSGWSAVDAYYATGWGGQRIMVFPSLDMVVVFTGGNYVEAHRLDVIIEHHILPALDEVP